MHLCTGYFISNFCQWQQDKKAGTNRGTKEDTHWGMHVDVVPISNRCGEIIYFIWHNKPK